MVLADGQLTNIYDRGDEPSPPRAGRGRERAKEGSAGRTSQGVAGQPGACLAGTVSLPCKPPTGLI